MTRMTKVRIPDPIHQIREGDRSCRLVVPAMLAVELAEFLDREIRSLAGFDDLCLAFFDLLDTVVELVGDLDRDLTDTMFVTVEQITRVDGEPTNCDRDPDFYHMDIRVRNLDLAGEEVEP